MDGCHLNINIRLDLDPMSSAPSAAVLRQYILLAVVDRVLPYEAAMLGGAVNPYRP